jgi:two-component system phosphate regulon sensor histidine kinase PhoR
MHNQRFVKPEAAVAIAVLSALISGLALGLGYWTWAVVPLIALVYSLWIIYWRIISVRIALNQLRLAINNLPEGDIPGLSATPGTELVRLAGALEEMSVRVRDQLTSTEEERNRLRAVFTSMRDAVITLGSTGRVALINPAAERFFKVTAANVVGRSVLEVIRHQQLAVAMQEILTSGQPTSLEFESFDIPNRHLHAELAPVLTTRGQRSGAVAVLHDVTEIRRLEEMRNQFVANVSHELRTPITSIKGFLETLLDGELGDTDTCRHFLTIISQEADRLANLVSDLLDLSQQEANETPLQKRSLQLITEAQGVLDLLQPLAASKQISMELKIPADTYVCADSAMLRQALLNLLDNAIKYNAPGGQVWVEATTSKDDPNQVVITVCDTGPGIASSHLNLLFDRFYRVDKARSRALGGTGLGLAIVRHIAERHGGKAWVQSELGRGSRFSISIPASAPPTVN